MFESYKMHIEIGFTFGEALVAAMLLEDVALPDGVTWIALQNELDNGGW